MDNIQKYVYMICFTGYMREQSKLAKDAGAEEFKLTGGKCKYEIRSRYGIIFHIEYFILLIEYFHYSAF